MVFQRGQERFLERSENKVTLVMGKKNPESAIPSSRSIQPNKETRSTYILIGEWPRQMKLTV